MMELSRQLLHSRASTWKLLLVQEKMSELEEGIRTAQENILKIAQTAAEESRKYTEEERQQIEELVGLIADYTAKKLKPISSRLK